MPSRNWTRTRACWAEYRWGGYVIYRLHDSGARVFVDGRNDMYDERIPEDYVRIRNEEEGWEDLLASSGANAILLPPETALVSGADQDAGRCEVHPDGVVVLLLHGCPEPRIHVVGGAPFDGVP
jgi:hypothetical protein